MSYDLIIVSQSIGDLIQVTEQCIDTSRVDGADLNIIVVETGNPYKYDVDKIVEYNGEFNYNRALNMGLKYAKNDVHILANNDLFFHAGWSQVGEIMKLNGYESASVLSQDQRQQHFQRGDFLYEGYGVGRHLTGWCLFATKECIAKIGKLDESFKFWYSDDIYALQIKKAGIKHALICNCRIDHITSRTLVRQDKKTQREYQLGELRKFNQIRNKYV